MSYGNHEKNKNHYLKKKIRQQQKTMSVVVVYYSRYNFTSIEFMEKVETIMEIRKLCVDEKSVRNRILTEKKNYNIQKVPSILIFHPNGFLEKHEGLENCQEWLNDVTPVVPLPVEEVTPIPKRMEKVPIEQVSFDDVRELDTKPIFDMKENETFQTDVNGRLKEEQESQIQNTVKKQLSQDGVMSLAQQMQKQREQDVKDDDPSF